MTTVQETVPEALRSDVEAALAWFNSQQDMAFEVTGILDPAAALAASGTRELRLVLCGGDRCEQRSFRVSSNDDGYEIVLLEDPTPPPDGPPEAALDPPPGALRGWLDRRLDQHAFLMLVFYRGYW